MLDSDQKSLGRFKILSVLGHGGFATVYRALDTSLEREVALKLLHPGLFSDPTFSQRFRREAKALGTLRHPNIIVVHEVGEAAGRLFLIMELVNGPTLAARIASQGAIAWPEILEILKPICEALSYAHRQGIIHRDLKPSNILLDAERGAVLSDFGLARLTGASGMSLTLSQGVLGTPSYIAPELWEQENASPASDIYALGCITYEMLTGKLLFAGATPMQIMRAHDKGPLFSEPWPEGIPPGIEGLLNRALAHAAGDRFPDALSFWQALNDLTLEVEQDRVFAEHQALVNQWRDETESAVRASEWRVARMAVGRWLALAPADPDAQSALAGIERQLAGQQSPQPALAIPKTGSRSFQIPKTAWIGSGAGIMAIVLLVAFLPGLLGRNSPAVLPSATAESPSTLVMDTATGLPDSPVVVVPTLTRYPTRTAAPKPTITKQPTAAPAGEPWLEVTSDEANIRTGPDIVYSAFTFVPGGTKLRILGENSDRTWRFVELPDGRTGWIADWVTSTSDDLSALPLITAPPRPVIVAPATPEPKKENTAKPTEAPTGPPPTFEPPTPTMVPPPPTAVPTPTSTP